MNVFIVSSKGAGSIIANCISENYAKNDYKIIKVHPASLTEKKKNELITLNDLPIYLNKDKNKETIEVGATDLEAIKNATNVFIGLEPDKYNQHCAENILRKIGRVNGGNKRIWFDAVTSKNIKHSLVNATPNELYKPISVRYELERNVNYLVGMNISVLFSAISQILGKKIWVSLSKDKLKVFRFMVDYLNDVKKTAGKINRGIHVYVEPNIKVEWIPNEAYLDDMGYMTNHGHQNEVLRLLKNETTLTLHQVNKSDEITIPPPLPLNINSLFALVKKEYPAIKYQEAHKALKILYYKGYILNPETYEVRYHERHRGAGAAFIKELHRINHPFAKQVQEEPSTDVFTDDMPNYLHGALMPIRGKLNQSRNLKNLERFIYSLIVKYFVAQYCKPYVLKRIEYKYKASKSHERFVLNTNEVIESGWRTILSTDEQIRSPSPQTAVMDSVKINKIGQESDSPCDLLTYQKVFDHFAGSDVNVWAVLEGLMGTGYISTSNNGYLMLTDDGIILSHVLDKVPNYNNLLTNIDNCVNDCTSEAGIGMAQEAIEHEMSTYISETFRLLDNEMKCPECMVGFMTKITKAQQKEFLGCCNYPLCDYTEELG